MRTIDHFAPSYPLTKAAVRGVTLVGSGEAEELDLPSPNIDFFVELIDDRIYSFVACTPDFIRRHLQENGLKAFISPGLVIVSEISVECLLAAVEECLSLDLLERIGIPQIAG